MVLKLDGKYYFIQLNWNGHFNVVFMLFYRSSALFVLLHFFILMFIISLLLILFFFLFLNRLTELDSVSTVNRLMEFH